MASGPGVPSRWSPGCPYQEAPPGGYVQAVPSRGFPPGFSLHWFPYRAPLQKVPSWGSPPGSPPVEPIDVVSSRSSRPRVPLQAVPSGGSIPGGSLYGVPSKRSHAGCPLQVPSMWSLTEGPVKAVLSVCPIHRVPSTGSHPAWPLQGVPYRWSYRVGLIKRFPSEGARKGVTSRQSPPGGSVRVVPSKWSR
jgi:hypothetical protein